MKETEKIIETFYTCFQIKDWKGMQSCYHDKIIFSDPVFQNLKGGEAKAMWHMLLEAGKDLKIEFKNIQSDGALGSCDWDAYYSFSKTGRQVHNVIRARFEFSEGKIIRHTDKFDLWRWAGMALGATGKMLGWTPVIQSKIRKGAIKSLQQFMKNHPEYLSH